MKGLKVVKAQPSNAIDVFPLIELASKEGLFLDSPSSRDLKNYYFKSLIKEMGNDFHLWFLAKRGRGFLGFVHGIITPRRWDGTIDVMYLDLVYVIEKRRAAGIGAKLIDEILKEAENIGVRKVEFLCDDSKCELWQKKRGAEKLKSLMRVTI